MMYDNDFVIAIIHDGSPVRETTGTNSCGYKSSTVHLPFNSEYKLRLKNKNISLRSKAKIWIDGRKVSNLGDFILKPGETLDLERFLDHSMDTGNKFKFVPLSDSKVNDPTDENNGVIKVEFYRERFFNFNIKSWDYIKTPLFFPNTTDPWVNGSVITYDNNSSFHCSNNVIASTQCYVDLGRGSSPGATVEGGLSNQKFVEGDFFQTDPFPTTLEIKIYGIDKSSVAGKNSAPPAAVKERFCSGCGKRRSKMSDKFCPRCGNKYNIVK